MKKFLYVLARLAPKAKPVFQDGAIRANLIDAIIEIGLSLLIGAVILGKTALPTFYAIATTGWDTYTILLWGLLPLVAVCGFMMAIIYHVKYQAWPFMR